MKKVLLFALLVLGTGMAASAQEKSAEEWEKMKVERVKKQAERKAEELNLKGDAKDNFIITYSQYQNALFSSARKSGAFPEGMRDKKGEGEKPELTEAEAKAKVEEHFARQEKQIAMMQARLAVQKQYYAEFAKTLTPQQLVKLFADPHRPNMNGRGRQGRPGGGGFGPGMGMSNAPAE